MIKYADETKVVRTDCTNEELRQRIEQLEMAAYGHKCIEKSSPKTRKVFSVKKNKMISM